MIYVVGIDKSTKELSKIISKPDSEKELAIYAKVQKSIQYPLIQWDVYKVNEFGDVIKLD